MVKPSFCSSPWILGGAPIGIFLGQAHNQVPEFLRNSRSTAARSRSPAPEEAKGGAVPTDHSFWFDDQEDSGPARPKAAQGGPEQPIAGVQERPRSLALEHSDLLAQSQDFRVDINSGPAPSAHGDQEDEEELDHELTVLTRRNATPIDALDVRATR